MNEIKLHMNQKVNACILGVVRTGVVAEINGNDCYLIHWDFLAPLDSYSSEHHIDQLTKGYIDC